MLNHHFTDLERADKAEGARLVVAVLGARTLRCEDGEEAAIDTAIDHARQVDLAAILLDRVAVGDVPAGPGEQRRRIHMSIEDDGGLMHRVRFRRHLYAAHGLGERGIGEQQCYGAEHDYRFHGNLQILAGWASSAVSAATGPALSSRLSLVRSSCFSQAATTSVATPLPIRFTSARHWLMKRSTPTSTASAATGMSGTTARVAASTMNPAPVTPVAPLEVSMATIRSVATWIK